MRGASSPVMPVVASARFSNGSGESPATGFPGSFITEPKQVDLGGTPVLVGSGNNHVCAALADGTLRCWGGAVGGRLGYGDGKTVGDDESPAQAGPVPY